MTEVQVPYDRIEIKPKYDGLVAEFYYGNKLAFWMLVPIVNFAAGETLVIETTATAKVDI